MTKPDSQAGPRIAYFVSPHGYGHAARACAVMQAIAGLEPAARFEIFTLVPRWFFEDSLGAPFGYHTLLTDIGLAQTTPFAEDLPETLRRLDAFLPFDAAQVRDLAELVNRLGCRLAMCDISPLGIAVASQAGIPSVLVENFTWDWIYEGYLEDAPAFSRLIAALREIFAAADYHVQTEPVCHPGPADLTTPPVGRRARTPREQIRRELGIPGHARMILVSMGGIPWEHDFAEQPSAQDGVTFVVPGGGQAVHRRGNLLLLPHHSSFLHSDLVNAADAVVGKAGYSTLAEVYQAGAPFGYVPRPGFRESAVLAAFIERHMRGRAIPEAEFDNGRWLSSAEYLLTLGRMARAEEDGAGQVARFICGLLA
jgi:hypothetical protein